MKKLRYIIVLLIGLLFTTNVYANDIKKITMDIYVDNNGNAHITEEWTASLSSGTEGYKPYYNLGTSEIKNFNVSMNGTNFNTLDYWDVDASFFAKKYKAGINAIDNGYELCFGITSYGTNTYKMKYTITNFVVSTEDSDMIYWQLIPYELSEKPDYIYIKIYSDFKYSNDLPVWGYGNYGGYAYVYNGYIELVHEDELDSDEYMTVLVKFPKGTFNTSTILEEDFDNYYEMAEDGATTYVKEKVNFLNIIVNVILFIIKFIPYIVIIIAVSCSLNSSAYGTKKLKFSKGAKKIKDAPYFRDIPCEKDIFKAYWVACQYGLVKNKTDFLGAILLKWLKEGRIQNITVESPILKREERAIKLLEDNNLTELEKELYRMMYDASNDGVLESNEFKHWCKINYNKILKWFNKIIDNVTMEYVNKGLIVEEQKTFSKIYLVSDLMKDSAFQMAGLKKFLNEFSNIQDRASIEVNLWEEYLIYAQIFGIAKKVAKEFKKLYPDVISDEYYNDIIFIHTISYNGVSAASAAKSRAESYSSGGGGFSSGGGGGGSFGGGGGGGGFR
ncbi:MAG: DUF2207 domain-containing protein [Firmicutes bacterium]|nr:DUF2207 domain-containing protein [Bacillota bacterium]